MKTFKIRTVHLVFSSGIFVSAHVIITQIMVPGMFSNLSLVVAGSLDPKFHFQLRKKSWREVPERVGHSTIRQMAAIA